jgi:hypothetical protein
LLRLPLHLLLALALLQAPEQGLLLVLLLLLLLLLLLAGLLA